MVEFVGGGGLGLGNTSLEVIGANGVTGDATTGRAGENVYVNTVTGNLVIQHQDEFLSGQALGPETSLLRTYNSQGLSDDDNGDNWRMGCCKTLGGFTAGVSVTRTDGDGTSFVYNFDAPSGKYICHTGGGALDTLAFILVDGWSLVLKALMGSFH